MRTLKTIGIVVGIYIAAVVMEVIMASSSSEYEGGIGAIVVLAFLDSWRLKSGIAGLTVFLL